MDHAQDGATLRTLLGLAHAPIAIAFRDHAPDGVKRIARSGPASCSYWSMAAAGEVFATEAADHLNCPVGAHTHGVPMSPEKGKELGELIQIMVKLEYLGESEVPQIPTRKGPFGVAIYAPLDKTPVDPDVVVVRGTARQIMLVAEAARSAGVASESSVMGRPACAILPSTMATARGETSLGCIGNRVYTGLADDELYFSIPGDKVSAVAARLAVIVSANQALEQFHGERRARLS